MVKESKGKKGSSEQQALKRPAEQAAASTRPKRERGEKSTHVCVQCDTSFTGAEALRDHILAVHEAETRPFSCEHCGRCFAQKDRLQAHMRSHTNDQRVFQCPECPKKFTRNGQLMQHRRTHAGTRPFKCNLCQAEFTSSGNLKVHLKRHLGVKEFECEVCGRCFTRRDGLQKHLSCYHGNEKPFECNICGKRYKGHLMQHFRTHLQEKPHACDQCDARFVQRSQLTVHLRVHSGEKPYECRECGRCFAHSTALKLHIRRHTGEKPFRCPICPASRFVQLPHLKKHMRCIHKSDKPYLCLRCREFYKKKAELDAHQETCRADENLPPGKCSNGTQTDPLPEFEDDELCLEMDEEEVDDPSMVKGEAEVPQPSEELEEPEEPTTPVEEPPKAPTPPPARSSRRPKPRKPAPQELTPPKQKAPRKAAPKPSPDKRVLVPEKLVAKITPAKAGAGKPTPRITLKLRKARLLHNMQNAVAAPPPSTRSSRKTAQPEPKTPKIRIANLQKLKEKRAENGEDKTAEGGRPGMDIQVMRVKVGKLLESISTPERLKALGFGSRAIDDVLHDSILGSGRKPCQEKQLPRDERLRKNVAMLLEWTIPSQFKAIRDQRSTEELLDELTS